MDNLLKAGRMAWLPTIKCHINSDSKMDYDKFIDVFSDKESKLLSKQIEHNLEQTLIVLNKG